MKRPAMTQSPFLLATALSALALGAGVPPSAIAQDGNRADPTAASAPVAGMKFKSAFSDYQPFREQPRRSWQEANQDVAENPGMGAMANMPGMNMPGMSMPGMDMKPGATPQVAPGAMGGAMGAMPGMEMKPGASPKGQQGAMKKEMGAMPGMDMKPGAARQGKPGAMGSDMGTMSTMGSRPGDLTKGAGGHEQGPMKAMPGMNKSAGAAPAGHGAMAMGGEQAAPGQPGKADNAKIAGTGLVRSVDKARGTVSLTHDPIAAMGWPAMTLSLRLKDSALADRVKPGDRVEFFLEQSSSGYVLSTLNKSVANAAEAKPPK